jgi:ribosomal protein L1
MLAIALKRPNTVKGKYFTKALVKTSMGPPLKLDLAAYQAMILTN